MVWKSEKSHEIQCLWTLHVTEHLITVRQILSNLQNKRNVPSLDRLNGHYCALRIWKEEVCMVPKTKGDYIYKFEKKLYQKENKK